MKSRRQMPTSTNSARLGCRTPNYKQFAHAVTVARKRRHLYLHVNVTTKYKYHQSNPTYSPQDHLTAHIICVIDRKTTLRHTWRALEAWGPAVYSGQRLSLTPAASPPGEWDSNSWNPTQWHTPNQSLHRIALTENNYKYDTIQYEFNPLTPSGATWVQL